ncbi:MAG: phosphatidate cytidylyltransferase, partial [Gemmatimonadales bacterium]
MAYQIARRILVAVVAIPLTILVVYVGRWLLVGLLAALAVLGAREFYRLAAHRGVQAFSAGGYLAAALIPIATFLALPVGAGLPARWMAFGGALWLLGLMAASLGRPLDQRPLAAIAVTAMGALYAGGLPAFLLLLRYPQGGASAVGATALALLPLVGTWICDTAAMAGGAALGGAKLAPA